MTTKTSTDRTYKSIDKSIFLVAVIVVSVWLFFAFTMPEIWLDFRMFASYLHTSSLVGILAVAVALLMIDGEIDLSIGGLIGFSSLITAKLYAENGFSPVNSVIISLIVVLGIGFLNGLLVTKLRPPSFLITLGTGFILYGLNNVILRQSGGGFIIFDGRDVELLHMIFDSNLSIGGVLFRSSIIWWLLIAALAIIFLRRVDPKSWFGTDKSKRILFMGTAFSAWLVATTQLTSFRGVNTLLGAQEEFIAIIAVIIGGAFRTRGYDLIIGTMLGALILGMVRQGVNIAGFAYGWFQVVAGGIFVIILIIYRDKFLHWSQSIQATYISENGDTTRNRSALNTAKDDKDRDTLGDVISYGGAEMDFGRSQTTRYLMAEVLLSSSFRKKIIKMVEQERNAFAPELGIDLAKVARVSYLLDQREKIYNIVYFIISLISMLTIILIPVGILITAAMYFYKTYQEKYKFIPYFKKNELDPDQLENMLRQKYPSADAPWRLPDEEQNLVVYKGFFPFVGAGFPIGGWSFSMNVNRPREEMGQVYEVKPFRLQDLYHSIEESIKRLDFNGFVNKDYLFVNGKEIRDERWLLPTIFSAPKSTVDSRVVQTYANHNDLLVRHYKWMQIYDWSNEIIISYFLRFSRQGDYLFVETNRCLLTPLQDEFREIDRLAQPKKSVLIGLGLGSLIAGPLHAIAGSFSVIGRIISAIGDWDLFGRKRRNKENEMMRDKKFDYGADSSLRTQVSSLPNHYFQVLDQEMYLKVLEKQIIEGLNAFLKDHNIDTSDIYEQQNMILNEGVIMEGGKVEAKSIAVGKESQATAGSSTV